LKSLYPYRDHAESLRKIHPAPPGSLLFRAALFLSWSVSCLREGSSSLGQIPADLLIVALLHADELAFFSDPAGDAAAVKNNSAFRDNSSRIETAFCPMNFLNEILESI
jgi:hypothetical protein